MVGVVLVSHSEELARGLAALCAQMAPDVTIATAGGDDDGGLGTSFDRVVAALDEADSGDGAVVLFDLGSAKMTSEMALEQLDDERRARTRLEDAPFVEGAVSAVTTADHGAGIQEVVAALDDVRGS